MSESRGLSQEQIKVLHDDYIKIRDAVANMSFGWANIENTLVSVLAAILGQTPDVSYSQHMASSIFFAPSNFETRIRIVDRAIRELFYPIKPFPAFHDEWSSFLTKLNRAKETRNKIAHGQIVTTAPYPNGPQRGRLCSPIFNIQAMRDAQKPNQYPGMGADEVEKHVSVVYSLVALGNEFNAVGQLGHEFLRSRRTPEDMRPLLQKCLELKRNRTTKSPPKADPKR